MNKKHLHEFAQTRILHLQICAQRKMWHVQICDFCIWKIYLRCRFAHFVHRRFFAHLQICVLHICTFAHLCFCVLHLCEKFFDKWKCFANMRAHENFYFSHFSQKSHFFPNLSKISKKSKFPKMSDSCPVGFWRVPENVRKKLTCSWVVHEWFLGQRVWQHRVAKVAEYALIRIAAGAPDLAKSPNPPPDGPGRPRKSRHFSLRTEKLPDSAPGLAFAPQAEILSGAVFPDPRTTRPSRQTDSEARRVLRQSPTHSANVRTLRKTLAENRRQGQRHSCTPCTPCTTETEPCTLVHNRATTPRHKWQRTHRPCVALVGEEGGAERPRAIESIRLISSNLLYNFNSTISMYICYSRYATAKSRTTKGKNSEWGDHTRIRTRKLCGTRRNASDFARTFFHRRKKDAKRSPKSLPFSIYI